MASIPRSVRKFNTIENEQPSKNNIRVQMLQGMKFAALHSKLNSGVMGKKDKKSSYKRQFNAFVSNNRVVLAALGGAVTGIALVNLMGNEKARKFISIIEGSVKHFAANHTPAGKLEAAR